MASLSEMAREVRVSKGLFKPAVGAMKQPIKGSWKTRHFPKRTAGGRRQLREQAEAKAASRAPSAADRMFDASYASGERMKRLGANQRNYGTVGASGMNRFA